MLKEYMGVTPKLGENNFIADGAKIIGNVTLKDEVSVWYNATIRGDINTITIGKGTNVQDNCVIHVNHEQPTVIGEGVTIGHGAIIHAATIGDHCLIGMGSIILDGARVEDNSIVGAGCVVPPNKVVPANSLVVGNPMKIVRNITNEEVRAIKNNKNAYVNLIYDYNNKKR